jgi:hypothetical protein
MDECCEEKVVGCTFDTVKVAVEGGLEESGLTCAHKDTEREGSPLTLQIAVSLSHSRGEICVGRDGRELGKVSARAY